MQEYKADGYIRSVVKKQGEMNTGAQLDFSFIPTTETTPSFFFKIHNSLLLPTSLLVKEFCLHAGKPDKDTLSQREASFTLASCVCVTRKEGGPGTMPQAPWHISLRCWTLLWQNPWLLSAF